MQKTFNGVPWLGWNFVELVFGYVRNTLFGTIAIFTIKFWSVLRYLAMWVDQNLIQPMYPDVNVFLQSFASPGEHDLRLPELHLVQYARTAGSSETPCKNGATVSRCRPTSWGGSGNSEKRRSINGFKVVVRARTRVMSARVESLPSTWRVYEG